MDATAELLRRARRLELGTGTARRTGPGAHASGLRGGGIEFSGVRQYAPGDDSKRIDWNVSARYGGLFVKEFVEDRELGTYAVLDVSASHDFGAERSKRERCLEVAASIMLSAAGNGDAAGLGMFTESLEAFVPAGRGRAHVAGMVRQMAAHAPRSAGTDVARSLAGLRARLGRGSAVFVVSDFVSGEFGGELALLAAAHRTVLVHVADPRESEMPDIGLALLEDAETGGQLLVDTSDAGFRGRYAALAEERLQGLAHAAGRAGARLVTLSGGGPFDAEFNCQMGGRR